MQAEERQYRIEEYLLKVEFASLEELARQVDASISTVRRDLDILEAGGNIRRTHGGARLVNPRTDEFAFSARDSHQAEEKDRIAQVCADLIPSGQTIIIDAGTTTYHVARLLEGKTIQLVTHSLPVAGLFSSNQKIEVVVSGGVIYPRLGVLVGPLAIEAFSKIHADVAVMSAGGITLDGLTNSHGLLIDIQRAIIQSASRVIFCLDHTKFNRKSVAFLCDLDSVDMILTDDQAPRDLVESLREKGIDVRIAREDGSVDIGKLHEINNIKRSRPSALQTAKTASPEPPSLPTPEPVTMALPESADSVSVNWD